jgi:hypothetical protein
MGKLKKPQVLKVESGIKIWKQARTGRPPLFPYAEMKVGDSFLAPLKGRSVSSVQKSVSSYGKAHGRQFTTRKLPDKSGIRVWRIK